MQMLFKVDNFLSEKECSDILTKCKNELTLVQASVYKPNSNNENTLSNKRKSSIAFIRNIDFVDERLKTTLDSLIKIKGYMVTGLAPYQFTEYKVGEYYDWHTDSTNDVYKERFASIVIQLNDEYDDGYLEVNLDGDNEIVKLPKGIGNLYVFYSNLRHRVTPINTGVRYSLVNWVSLEKIKEYKSSLI